MNELITSIANLFSTEFSAQYAFDEPADEYFDPLINVFGESPSKKGAISILNKRVSDLTTELSNWLEIELEATSVKETLRRALTNFYGENL